MFTLIDGDILVYACGFSSQKNKYTVAGESFTFKKDAKLLATSKGIPYEEITHEILPEPIEVALGNVKQSLLHIAEICDSEDGNIYLTGKGNYRKAAGVTHPYKGNRDTTHKPFYYDEITQYLIKHWDAEVIDGMEADDAMGIAQCSGAYEDPIICSIDKDLDMIPGNHYNWGKGKMYWVTEEEGLYFFHLQMLMGDRTDNIYAIDGVGPKTAEKLLKGKSPEEREHIIKKKYLSHFGASGMDRYKENETLLWILREPLKGDN